MSDLGVTVGRSGDRHPKLLTSGLEGSVETSRWADTSASAQTASCADPAGPAGAAELAEVGRAVRALAGVVDREAGLASRPDLAAVIEESQGLINMLTAVQDVAITHVAAIEEEWDEDGLVVESRGGCQGTWHWMHRTWWRARCGYRTCKRNVGWCWQPGWPLPGNPQSPTLPRVRMPWTAMMLTVPR